jgi:hypothetical protein
VLGLADERWQRLYTPASLFSERPLAGAEMPVNRIVTPMAIAT